MSNLPHEVQMQKVNGAFTNETRYATQLKIPFSYEALKEKGIYIFSRQNGKSYALSRTKPFPTYFWKRLKNLPENIKLFEVCVGPAKREYLITVIN
jgi:hypothetical protein